MNHIAQQQFLALLKAGLWGIEADTELFAGGVDWISILRIANEQTVPVIVADGIETLPSYLWPPKNLIMRLFALRVKTAQMNKLLNSTLSQIVLALNAEGVPMVLLKGQGVAQNYIKPESRCCGDIDLYTGVGGYKKACEVIASLNRVHDKTGKECVHHMHLSFNGVEIEVHRQAGFMQSKRLDASFQKWTQESIDVNFGTSSLLSWNNDGTDISLASPTFDAFFILYHALRHMTTEGVGFRQICDWTMYLHKHHTDIDCVELRRRLKEYRMEAVWREFGILAVNVLGLPVAELPLAQPPIVSDKTTKILKHIFISGNFGRFDLNGRDRSNVPYLISKWRGFRFQMLRLCKLFSLFPCYTASYMWHWFTGAIWRCITHSDR